jgi:hypothetical protein
MSYELDDAAQLLLKYGADQELRCVALGDLCVRVRVCGAAHCRLLIAAPGYGQALSNRRETEY